MAQLDVAQVAQAPAAAPGESERLGHFAVELVAAQCPGVLFTDDDASVAQERDVRGESVLVVALERSGVRHVRPHGLQHGLPFRAAIAFEEHHRVAVLLLHDPEHQQQPLPELRVEAFPLAIRAGQQWAGQLELRRGEHVRRHRRRRHELFSLQQPGDQ